MTKEELYDRWINDFGPDYQITGVRCSDKFQFFKDLEDWYASRHEKELNVIKEEVIKSLDEMNAAINAVAEKETKHRANLKELSDNTFIHLSTKGGYNCYD